MIEGKVWGETSVVLKTPFVEMHLLRIVPDSFCSWHKHERKWNAFACIRGKLLIEVKKASYGLTDVTELREGDLTTVRPGEVHRFRALDEDVLAWEFYYPDEMTADVIRESVGGRGAEQYEIKLPNDEGC